MSNSLKEQSYKAAVYPMFLVLHGGTHLGMALRLKLLEGDISLADSRAGFYDQELWSDCIATWPWGKIKWCRFGVGAPILVYFSGDWDVHWEYGILTHGDMNACMCYMESS